MSTREYIAKTIRRLRTERKMSVDQVGAAIGKSGKTISAWEIGRGQPDADKLIELCNLFGVEISDFYGGQTISSQSYATRIGRIVAGTPLEAIELDGEPMWVDPNVKQLHPNAFFLTVHGDSMNLRFVDGCNVLVDPDQRQIVNGKVYAVLVNGFDATLKQVFVAGNTIVLHPQSTNPSHRDISIDASSPDAPYFAVVGRVVWASWSDEHV